ncbi:MAG: hypothetical protein CM1200mP27_01380 [Chloroflexota bacterium]|nr:MAG: hypothetical protein CM1200mP27_01380 [Chloroflexota bacterium]
MRQEAEIATSEVLRKQRELDAQLADFESTKANLVEESRQELQGRLSEILGKLSKAERSLDAGRLVIALTPQLTFGSGKRFRRTDPI